MEYSALIVAAGSGSRMNLGFNKVYAKLLDGRTILQTTIDVFLNDVDCKQVVVVSDANEFIAHHPFISGKITLVKGGKTRQESVEHGLIAVCYDYVLIHDGARPYITQENIDAIKSCLEEKDACLLMVPCKDTIKKVVDGKVVETYDRSTLMAAQTPQAFLTSLIIDCMKQAKKDHYVGTDDASLVEKYSDVPIQAVLGSYANYKITTIEDLK